MAQSEIKSTAGDRDRLAIEFRNRSGVIFERAGAEGNFVTRVADGLADVEHLELRQFFEVCADGGGDFEEYFGAFAGGQIAPGLFIGELGAGDGFRDVEFVGWADFGKSFFSGRIDQRHGFAGSRRMVFAIEERESGDLHGD